MAGHATDARSKTLSAHTSNTRTHLSHHCSCFCCRCIFEKHRRGRKPGSKYVERSYRPAHSRADQRYYLIDQYISMACQDYPRPQRCSVVSRRVLPQRSPRQQLSNSQFISLSHHPSQPAANHLHDLHGPHHLPPSAQPRRQELGPANEVTRRTLPLILPHPQIRRSDGLAHRP